MKIKVKKLHADAKLPVRAHETDICFGIYGNRAPFKREGAYWHSGRIARRHKRLYMGQELRREQRRKGYGGAGRRALQGRDNNMYVQFNGPAFCFREGAKSCPAGSIADALSRV